MHPFNEGEKYKDQLDELNGIRQDVAKIGVTITDEQMVMQILSALPASWEIFRTTVLSSVPSATQINLADLIKQITEEEDARKQGGIQAYVAR